MTGAGAEFTRLYVGLDAEKVVVGPDPLTMRTGRALRRRFGSITEVVPAPPSGRGRGARIRFLAQLATVLLLLSGVLTAAALPWWAPAVGSLVILGFVARDQARAAAVGTIEVPRDTTDDRTCHVLYGPKERAAFARSFVVAQRIQRTWPALRHMIDSADAERMLSRALTDLAGILARREQLRRLREELSVVSDRGLPADSPAVQALAVQRSRLDELWRDTGAEANRHIRTLHAAATAGESLIREQRVGRTARDAERAIAHLTHAAVGVPAPGPVLAHGYRLTPVPDAGLPGAGPSAAGQELADRTAAVIAAYRELAARHTQGV